MGFKCDKCGAFALSEEVLKDHPCPSLPPGKQTHPVMVGRHKNGDIIIQAGGAFVQIPAEHAPDLPAAIMMAIAHRSRIY